MIKTIFQFILGNNIAALENAVNGKVSSDISIIIDLEDGLQDVINFKNTKEIKQEARKTLNTFLKNSKIKENKTGIRINSIHSEEFRNDLEFLRNFKNDFNPHYIVIPKLNSKNELENYISIFIENEIKYGELIPIIETKVAMNNLADIFSEPARKNFHRAFWGHHDYNLEINCFPFFDYRSQQYWELTQKIINQLNKNNYEYINGAFLEINNRALLSKVVSAISCLSKSDFHVVALTYDQAMFLSSLKNVMPVEYSEFVSNKIYSEIEVISIAENTIEQFQERRSGNKSFSLSNNAIISPQQFLAAKNYLKQKSLVVD